MTKKQAIHLLHPDTTKSALQGKTKQESIELINKACVLACEALENYNSWMPATTPPKSGECVYTYYKSGNNYWTDLATYYTIDDIYWQDVEKDGFYKYDSEYGHSCIENVLFWTKMPVPPKMTK